MKEEKPVQSNQAKDTLLNFLLPSHNQSLKTQLQLISMRTGAKRSQGIVTLLSEKHLHAYREDKNTGYLHE